MIITGGGGRGAVFTSLFVSDRCNVVPCHEKKKKQGGEGAYYWFPWLQVTIIIEV